MVEVIYNCKMCKSSKLVTYENLYHNSSLPRVQCCHPVKGVVFQHSHEPSITCGTRCAVATNSMCHCSCDGKNHGIAYRNFIPA